MAERKKLIRKPKIFVDTSNVSKMVKKYVKTEIKRNIELKDYLVDAVDNAITQSPSSTVLSLTSIPQGDGVYERTGNRIKVERVKGRLQIGGTADFTVGPVRVLLVQDKTNSGTVPTLLDVLPNLQQQNLYTATQHGSTDEEGMVLSMQKFRILYDKTKYISSEAGDRRSGYATFNINKRLGTYVKYTGNLGTEEAGGQIYLFISSAVNDADIKGQWDIITYFRDA